MAKLKDNQLISWSNDLTGRCIKSLDPLKISFVSDDGKSINKNFSNLINIKYTDNGITGVVKGMTKINTTALSSFPKIQTMFQFKKVQPAETHIIVQAQNSGEDSATVYQNTTAIPNSGDFSGIALHTDAPGAGLGRISDAPDEHMVYCNGVETMVWGGDKTQPSIFIIYDEFGDTFSYNYTEKVKNSLTDATNVASTVLDGDTPAKCTFLIGNTLPIEGFTLTVPTVNTNILDDALKVFEWDGSTWSAVTTQVDGTITGTSPNEVTLGQSGTVVFDSTELTARQSVLNGILGFYYKVEITGLDNTTRISQVTLQEPFQLLQDYWDNEGRISASVQLFSRDIYKDNTVNVSEDSFVFSDTTEGNTATYMNMSELETSTEHLVIGFSERQQGLGIKMIPEKSNQDVAATGTVAISNGSLSTTDSFNALTIDGVTVTDGTSITLMASNSTMALNLKNSINRKTSNPNYTAEVDNETVTITADARGTGPNGFVLASTDTGVNPHLVNMTGGLDIAATLTIKYWNGTAWVTVGTIVDDTKVDGASFGQSGFITWNAIAENIEFKTNIAGEEPLFYYRLEWDSKFSPDTLCYNISGIPVQRVLSNYKFPLSAQGRLWLFSDQSQNKNEVIVSNFGELNTFNGKGVGDPLVFGDKTEIIAAIELFEKTTTKVESRILVLKENATFVVEGDNPENWKIVDVERAIGCNAPYTLATSTIGLEFGALQRKQVSIWQGSSGIYMFDNQAVHLISDDISNFFDQRNADSINLAKVNLSYGWFEVENGEHNYHWCFVSGSNTACDKEWVFDLRRQRWYEIVRGNGKAIQGGAMMVDNNGNIYNYAFIDSGYVERLNNGTTYDGNDIDYTLELGDEFPVNDINILTSLDSVRLSTVSKTNTSNSILCYHYGDTKTAATVDSEAGTSFYTLSTKKTGQRVAFPFKRINTPPHMCHRLKFTISTNNENVGFEPLYVGGFYKTRGIQEVNLTD